MLSKCFAQILAGEVRTFLCTDVIQAISCLELSEMEGHIDGRTVVLTWEKLPEHETVLEDILQALARVALAIWPSWYGQEVIFRSSHDGHPEDSLLNQSQLQELRATRKDVSLPWLKSAVSTCRALKLPVFRSFSRTVQVSQLALALEPHNLVVVLAICDRQPQPYRLLSVARAATWLAKETMARVAVLIPRDFAENPELDSILYKAIAISFSQEQPIDSSADEESKHTIWPVKGKPHPFSLGEQLLAGRLSEDADLSGLFCFNQSAETVRGSRYLVDLLWEEGKVVIEVDGYRHHGNRFAFGKDRHRDYELLISGYITLRLPHDEIVNDLEIAVEKIRDVVRFRQNQPIQQK